MRIQVKQSAARQTWHGEMPSIPRPCFSIASKIGRWEGSTWIAEPGRNAEIFIFAWHPVTDTTADHRDLHQWEFFVVAEIALPTQKAMGLAGVRKLANAVRFDHLRAEIERTAAVLENTGTK